MSAETLTPTKVATQGSARRGPSPAYLAHRVGQGAGVLLATFTLAFLLLQFMPGDSLVIRFENPELGLSADEIADLRATYGADRPVIVQYLTTLGAFLTGDLGYSITTGTPVAGLIASALPDTLALAGSAFVLAILLAVGITLLASSARHAWIANTLAALPSLFVAVPVFWLGIMLVQVFSFHLGWVPVINPGPAQGLILPVATLAVPISAPIAQVFLRSIDEVRTSPFVTVMRSKGASEAWILWRGVLKGALAPTVTVAGVIFGELIGGAVVTETIFARTGIGRLAEQAVANQDTVVLQAIVVLTAAAFVAITLIVDLLQPLLDPRVGA